MSNDYDAIGRAYEAAFAAGRAAGWDDGIRTAIRLIAPRPLKADADGFDRLAHKVSTAEAHALAALIGHPEFAATPVTEPVEG